MNIRLSKGSVRIRVTKAECVSLIEGGINGRNLEEQVLFPGGGFFCFAAECVSVAESSGPALFFDTGCVKMRLPEDSLRSVINKPLSKKSGIYWEAEVSEKEKISAAFEIDMAK
ncbi:MAG: hypothetical protein AABZ06_13140 [Bdellovibrionota bacterium]